MRNRAAALLACAALAGAAPAQETPQQSALQPSPAQQAAPQQQPHVKTADRGRAQRAFVEGAKAIDAKDLRKAADAFGKAAALDPTNRDYEAALAIAKDNLATQWMQQALKLRLQGNEAGARAMMKNAAAEDSRNPMVVEHQHDMEDEEPPRDATLNPIRDDSGPVVEFAPLADKHSFHTVQAKGDLIKEVLGAYGVTPNLDASVDSARVHFDADDVTFAQASDMLTLATGTFLVPLDPQRALAAADTKENRAKFERLSLETVYLPALTTQELNDVGNIARNVFEAQQATVHEASNTLTVRAPALKLKAFNTEINELLAGRNEIILDVDIYEVQTQRTANEGVELPQTTNVFNVTSELNTLIRSNPTLVQQIISSGLASPGNIGEIALALIASGQAGSTLLSQPFATFGGGLTLEALTLSSATANAQLNSSDTRMLDKLQLRLLDQEEGTIKIGERYPIVTSQYSNLATGSASIAGITSAGLSNTLQNLGVNLSALSSAQTASVPQVQYQDIGLTLTATSRVQQGKEVSLKLRLQLSSLSGATLNSNPIINNRETTSFVDVKPGERTVLVSQLSSQESTTLIGIPGLSEIPGLNLATNRNPTTTRDSIVIMLTPHIVRLSHTQRGGQLVLLPAHS